ncbi:MAG: hypothetical protein E7084_06320 [Bacteroidales bacterium]|nr:hypothetical protein [Bacteroidales bacterium]
MESIENRILKKRKIKYTSDWTLWACYIILCAVSVVEVFSASSQDLKNGLVYLPITSHIQWLVLGFVAMFTLEHIHYKWTKAMMFVIVAGAVVLAILTPFIGVNRNGAVRSIELMGISIQAAEPCKLACAMLLAYVLSYFQKPDGTGLSKKGIYYGIGIIVVFVLLLVTQGGSNAILIMMVGGTLMILSVLPRKLVITGAAVLVVVVGVGVGAIMSMHNKQEATPTEQVVTVEKEEPKSEVSKALLKFFARFDVWKDRFANWAPDGIPEYEKPTTDENSQEHHAYMAIANGRGIGVLPGNSRECSRLQLAFSDYIYAIILEELGLFGGIIVLLCYLGIVIRACMIAKKCKSAYASLLIMGMALVIVYQAFYHMCIAVGVIPVSGQPLPFISKGGTSILIMSMAMGMMLSVSRYAVERTDSGLKTIDDDDELPDDLRADNPARGF